MHVVYCCFLDVTGSWVLAVHTSMDIYLGKVATSATVFESVVSHHGFMLLVVLEVVAKAAAVAA